MINKEEAIRIAENYILEQSNQSYPLILAYFVKGQESSFYTFDHWNLSFQLPLEWDPNEMIIIVNAENGKVEGFPTL